MTDGSNNVVQGPWTLRTPMDEPANDASWHDEAIVPAPYDPLALRTMTVGDMEARFHCAR